MCNQINKSRRKKPPQPNSLSNLYSPAMSPQQDDDCSEHGNDGEDHGALYDCDYIKILLLLKKEDKCDVILMNQKMELI